MFILPKIPLAGVYPAETLEICKDVHMRMISEVLFAKVKIWKLAKCLSKGD